MPKKGRLNILISQEERDGLERMRKALRADNVTDVIRRSLRLMGDVLEARERGDWILFCDQDGKERPLLVL